MLDEMVNVLSQTSSRLMRTMWIACNCLSACSTENISTFGSESTMNCASRTMWSACIKRHLLHPHCLQSLAGRWIENQLHREHLFLHLRQHCPQKGIIHGPEKACVGLYTAWGTCRNFSWED